MADVQGRGQGVVVEGLDHFDQPGVLSPDVGLEGTMKLMAGRKRHSAEYIVRKLRRADELAAEGKTGEEIAAKLGVSAALYNWRRTDGGMDTDAAKELKSCANVLTPVAPRSRVRDNGVVGRCCHWRAIPRPG
jgi:putative transposase